MDEEGSWSRVADDELRTIMIEIMMPTPGIGQT